MATNVLWRQTYLCRDKTRLLSRQTRVCFVAINTCFSYRCKHVFLLSQQTCVPLIAANMCFSYRGKHVFLLSGQTCANTKMLIAAAPANDRSRRRRSKGVESTECDCAVSAFYTGSITQGPVAYMSVQNTFVLRGL